MPAFPEQRSAYRGTAVTVLGASGFIGQWVARALIASGAAVTLVARHASGIAPDLLAGAGATMLEADLSSESAVREMIASAAPQVVFNLAGYGVDRGERDERLAHATNTELPRWIVAPVARVPGGGWMGHRIVHAGSALEYGVIGGDLSEDSTPHPTTLYGRTKLAGTLALRDVCQASDVRGVTARLFTVYGAGEHEGRLLPTLLHARTHAAEIPLSEGRQQRDFTYVEDVADGLLRLGAAEQHVPGGVVNVASGTLTAVRDFVYTAADALGIGRERLAFGALPTRPEEMQHDPVSNRRLRESTAWVPAIPIAEGVRRTAQHVDGGTAATRRS